MALSPTERVRYARHLLLAEIGPEGQARLCAASYRVEGDSSAARVAVDYIERAGVGCAAEGSVGDVALSVPSSEAVDALAGRPELREAAAALAGALAAVEAVKTITAAGRRGAPLDFTLGPAGSG